VKRRVRQAVQASLHALDLARPQHALEPAASDAQARDLTRAKDRGQRRCGLLWARGHTARLPRPPGMLQIVGTYM
jgi:hypothetical protein